MLIHVRANAALKAVQARQDYPTALSVRVAFNISTERRAPTKLEQAEYEEIEEEISSRLGVCMEGHFPPRDYWP